MNIKKVRELSEKKGGGTSQNFAKGEISIQGVTTGLHVPVSPFDFKVFFFPFHLGVVFQGPVCRQPGCFL